MKLHITYLACRGCLELIGIAEVICPYCGQPSPHEIDAPRPDGSQHPSTPAGDQDDRVVGPAPWTAEGRRSEAVA